jgi:hypothetical protein
LLVATFISQTDVDVANLALVVLDSLAEPAYQINLLVLICNKHIKLIP